MPSRRMAIGFEAPGYTRTAGAVQPVMRPSRSAIRARRPWAAISERPSHRYSLEMAGVWGLDPQGSGVCVCRRQPSGAGPQPDKERMDPTRSGWTRVCQAAQSQNRLESPDGTDAWHPGGGPRLQAQEAGRLIGARGGLALGYLFVTPVQGTPRQRRRDACEECSPLGCRQLLECGSCKSGGSE
jgi:hypothetical protein